MNSQNAQSKSDTHFSSISAFFRFFSRRTSARRCSSASARRAAFSARFFLRRSSSLRTVPSTCGHKERAQARLQAAGGRLAVYRCKVGQAPTVPTAMLPPQALPHLAGVGDDGGCTRLLKPEVVGVLKLLCTRAGEVRGAREGSR